MSEKKGRVALEVYVNEAGQCNLHHYREPYGGWIIEDGCLKVYAKGETAVTVYPLANVAYFVDQPEIGT